MKKTFTTLAATLFMSSFLLGSTTLNAKPIPEARYVGGGIAGIFVPFGIGHAIQGRYREMGWIFTVSELAAVGLVIGGGVSLFANGLNREKFKKGDFKISDFALGFTLIGVGAVTYFGFRVWEMIDLWATPEVILADAALPSIAKSKRYAALHGANTQSNNMNVGFTLRF